MIKKKLGKKTKKLDAATVKLVKKVTGKKASDLKKNFKAHKKISKTDKAVKQKKIAKVFGEKK